MKQKRSKVYEDLQKEKGKLQVNNAEPYSLAVVNETIYGDSFQLNM